MRPGRECEVDAGGERLLVPRRAAYLGPGSVLFWLTLLTAPAADIWNHRVHPASLAIAGLTVFAVVFVPTAWTAMARGGPRGPAWLRGSGLVVVVALATLLYLRFGQGWSQGFTLASMCAVVVLPVEPWAPLGFFGVTVIAVSASLATGNGGWDTGTSALLAGVVTYVIIRLFAAVRQMHELREQLADAAVASERLRFARDLHDLLGHTLSLIVVKGEVVQRTIDRNPRIAAAQAADIVTIGREALAEVREAVTGYRERPLADELDHARRALDDAGVDAVMRRGAEPVPAAADRLLGWVVREAVTNVIRHAAAHHCRIELRVTGTTARLEVRDDGSGSGGAGAGNGLTGITERLAAAGGTLRAGDLRGGGYRLVATVPLDAAGGPPAPGEAVSAGETVPSDASAPPDEAAPGSGVGSRDTARRSAGNLTG